MGIEKAGSGARTFGGAIHVREEKAPGAGKVPLSSARLIGCAPKAMGDAWLIPTRARMRGRPCRSVIQHGLIAGGLSLVSRRRRAVDAFVERGAVDSTAAHPSRHAPQDIERVFAQVSACAPTGYASGGCTQLVVEAMLRPGRP